MVNPVAFGDPDHYSIRFTGTDDNGGVHINSGIPNHAFYLAVAGGTNRVSGLSVTGVGIANIEQMEKVFYRAFVFLMPANCHVCHRASGDDPGRARSLWRDRPGGERGDAGLDRRRRELRR